MQRTIVFKLKPTRVQVAGLARYLYVLRMLWNAALERRITAYKRCGVSLGWMRQSRDLKEARAAGLLEGIHVHAARLTLKRLDLAYRAFFARNAAGKRGGFPRFKGARYFRSFGFKEHGNGWRINGDRLKISGVGDIRVRAHRPLPGEPKTCTVIRKADGWYAHIVVEIADVSQRPDLDPSMRASVDLGVEALATLHTGERIETIRALRHAAKKLKAEQRALARKKRGSRRRAKQAERVAKAHQKAARVRRDHLHKQSRLLAEQYRFVAVEDLTITAMSHSAKGSIERPGRRVRQKAGLNRAILDAGWGEFLSLLDYKLAEKGGGLIRVDPRGTSQACSNCGVKVAKALSEREHRCPACGVRLHRDHNAALNIYQRAWAAPVAEAA